VLNLDHDGTSFSVSGYNPVLAPGSASGAVAGMRADGAASTKNAIRTMEK